MTLRCKLFGHKWTDYSSIDNYCKRCERQKPESLKLTKIAWEETKTYEYDIIKETLVWSGGAEKTIEYVDRPSSGPWKYLDGNGDVVLDMNEQPAYFEDREVIGTHTEEQTQQRTAWVNGDVPEGAERIDTKTVNKQEL